MASFTFPLRIYIDDTDFGGVVYHANYLKFFERARSEWTEQLKIGTEWQRTKGVYFLVRYAKIEFLRPAQLHQEVEVISSIKEYRKASLIYDQYLRLKERPDTILCKAEIKVACVDSHFKPCALPKLFVNLLTENECEH
jgi:acyl-CoA thioester hydrolase